MMSDHIELIFKNVNPKYTWNEYNKFFSQCGNVYKLYISPEYTFGRVHYDSVENGIKAVNELSNKPPFNLNFINDVKIERTLSRSKDGLFSLPSRKYDEVNGGFTDQYVDILGHSVNICVFGKEQIYVPLSELKRMGLRLFTVEEWRTLEEHPALEMKQMSSFKLYMKMKAAEFITQNNVDIPDDKINDVINEQVKESFTKCNVVQKTTSSLGRLTKADSINSLVSLPELSVRSCNTGNGLINHMRHLQSKRQQEHNELESEDKGYASINRCETPCLDKSDEDSQTQNLNTDDLYLNVDDTDTDQDVNTAEENEKINETVSLSSPEFVCDVSSPNTERSELQFFNELEDDYHDKNKIENDYDVNSKLEYASEVEENKDLLVCSDENHSNQDEGKTHGDHTVDSKQECISDGNGIKNLIQDFIENLEINAQNQSVCSSPSNESSNNGGISVSDSETEADLENQNDFRYTEQSFKTDELLINSSAAEPNNTIRKTSGDLDSVQIESSSPLLKKHKNEQKSLNTIEDFEIRLKLDDLFSAIAEISDFKLDKSRDDETVADDDIRCGCKIYKNFPHIGLVICLKCLTFQHCVCSGYLFQKDVPDDYSCQECELNLYSTIRKDKQGISVYRLIVASTYFTKEFPKAILDLLPREIQISMIEKLTMENIFLKQGAFRYVVNTEMMNSCFLDKIFKGPAKYHGVIRSSSSVIEEDDDNTLFSSQKRVAFKL